MARNGRGGGTGIAAGVGASSGVAIGSGDSVGLPSSTIVSDPALAADEDASEEAWDADAAEKAEESAEDAAGFSFFLSGFCLVSFFAEGEDEGMPNSERKASMGCLAMSPV